MPMPIAAPLEDVEEGEVVRATHKNPTALSITTVLSTPSYCQTPSPPDEGGESQNALDPFNLTWVNAQLEVQCLRERQLLNPSIPTALSCSFAPPRVVRNHEQTHKRSSDSKRIKRDGGAVQRPGTQSYQAYLSTLSPQTDDSNGSTGSSRRRRARTREKRRPRGCRGGEYCKVSCERTIFMMLQRLFTPLRGRGPRASESTDKAAFQPSESPERDPCRGRDRRQSRRGPDRRPSRRQPHSDIRDWRSDERGREVARSRSPPDDHRKASRGAKGHQGKERRPRLATWDDECDESRAENLRAVQPRRRLSPTVDLSSGVLQASLHGIRASRDSRHALPGSAAIERSYSVSDKQTRMESLEKESAPSVSPLTIDHTLPRLTSLALESPTSRRSAVDDSAALRAAALASRKFRGPRIVPSEYSSPQSAKRRHDEAFPHQEETMGDYSGPPSSWDSPPWQGSVRWSSHPAPLYLPHPPASYWDRGTLSALTPCGPFPPYSAPVQKSHPNVGCYAQSSHGPWSAGTRGPMGFSPHGYEDSSFASPNFAWTGWTMEPELRAPFQRPLLIRAPLASSNTAGSEVFLHLDEGDCVLTDVEDEERSSRASTSAAGASSTASSSRERPPRWKRHATELKAMLNSLKGSTSQNKGRGQEVSESSNSAPASASATIAPAPAPSPHTTSPPIDKSLLQTQIEQMKTRISELEARKRLRTSRAAV